MREERDLDIVLKEGGRAAVVGLGASGMAALRLLKRQGMQLRACDSRGREKLADRDLQWLERNSVELALGAHRPESFKDCDLVVLSPGVDQRQPAFAETGGGGPLVIGELELASSLTSTPIAAITGTNGKSTVVSLLSEILNAAGKGHFLGGNYGTPLSSYLCDPVDSDWLLLEVSSFQLDTSPGFRPDIGVLLNITPDHLDRYQDFAAYCESKFSLFRNQGTDDLAILNNDDLEISSHLDDLPGRGKRVFFGRDEGGDLPGVWVSPEGLRLRDMGPGMEDMILPLDNPILAVGINRINSAAAVAAAIGAGCPLAAIRRGMATFKSLEHRMAKVARINGVDYLDDSKATNIGAVAAALAELAGPVILIAGGREKGSSYEALVGVVKEKVRALLVIGEAREAMVKGFSAYTRVEPCEDMAAAVRRAEELAQTGDTVLLSPACASFDMFAGYAERGNVFRDAVLALRNKKEVIA